MWHGHPARVGTFGGKNDVSLYHRCRPHEQDARGTVGRPVLRGPRRRRRTGTPDRRSRYLFAVLPAPEAPETDHAAVGGGGGGGRGGDPRGGRHAGSPEIRDVSA